MAIQSPPKSEQGVSTQARALDFLVIGAARSGTTSLWKALDSHPQIAVPSDKEREFFGDDERYSRGMPAFISQTFRDTPAGVRRGTVTPQLMAPDPREAKIVVGRIAETCPDVKMVALLRDPVERAISQFRRIKKVTGGQDRNFEAYITRLTQKRGQLAKIPLIRSSDYGRILRFYNEAFDRDQLRIYFTEELDQDPDMFYRRLFKFLGVDRDHSHGTPRIHIGGTKKRVTAEALQEVLVEVERYFSSAGMDE